MEKIKIIVQMADVDTPRALSEMQKLFKENGGLYLLLESIDHDSKKVDKFLFSCFYQQAFLHQRLDQHQKALDIFMVCMNLMAQYNENGIWYAIGISLFYLQRYNEAGPYFLHYLKTNPPEKENVQRFIDRCIVELKKM